MFVRFYTLTGVSPRDTPHNATLPGPCSYDELDLLRNWRGFLDAPERYLRHLLE